MSDFSLSLNEDQIQIRDWVHEFAKDVVRPVAEEWDERKSSRGPSCRKPPRSVSTASTSWRRP